MMHDHHPSLEGYDPLQILHDGCGECERRGRDVCSALAHLDTNRFVHAWRRAGELQRYGIKNGSRAELPLLHTLAQVQVGLERFNIPLGMVPMLDEEGNWAGV